MFQCKNAFDQTCDARSTFGMTDVGFYLCCFNKNSILETGTTDGSNKGTFLAKHVSNCCCFYRVACWSTGTVALEVWLRKVYEFGFGTRIKLTSTKAVSAGSRPAS